MAALDQPPPVTCTIVRQEVGEQLRFRGLVIARRDASGTYSIHVTKSSSSGNSAVVNQRGRFVAPAGQQTFVGLAAFKHDADARYKAEAAVRVGKETYSCPTAYP
jgi:hypothetical protein